MIQDESVFSSIRAIACDLNGQRRGKRLPGHSKDKLIANGMRMPFSALNVDLFGSDIDDSPLVFATGDADGVLHPLTRGFVSAPWLGSGAAILPMAMYDDAGRPFGGDPIHALSQVLSRYQERGLHIQAATEMEFYLVDDHGPALQPPRHPFHNRPIQRQDVLSIESLDAFGAFFDALYESCDQMGIPAEAATSEAGTGQFEVNLVHRDAAEAALDAWLFKYVASALARKFNLAACFMAKPFDDQPGNGLHVHFSVLDETGANIFDDGSQNGSVALKQAIAGCLRYFKSFSVISAPFPNSFLRLVPGAHAPTAACWGYENRTVALRVPGGANKARRIEYRVAGGDINPFLLFAALFGAALTGMEDQLDPPAAVQGNAYAQSLPRMADDLGHAITALQDDKTAARIFDPILIENLILTKKQELMKFSETPELDHWGQFIDMI